MSYSAIQLGFHNEVIGNDATAISKAATTPGQALADNDPRRVNAIRILEGATFRTQGGSTTHVGDERVQLIDRGNSVVVGGVRTSPEAALTLQKQAPHLTQSGPQNIDPGETREAELAKAVEQADRETGDFDTISNEIGRAVVQELRGVGQGSLIPVVLSLMSADSRKSAIVTQRLSEVMNEDVSLTRGKVQVAMDTLARQCQKYVESTGASFEDFSAWAQRSHAETSANVMVRHATGNGKVSELWGPLLRMYSSRPH
jgi:hypothetical protein